jgi:DNA-binding IclR family transcriptional regulator
VSAENVRLPLRNGGYPLTQSTNDELLVSTADTPGPWKRVQSVERCIDILMYLADRPDSLTGIAQATNLSKGTAFRLLATLGYCHLVVKDPDSKEYVLGPGSLRLVGGIMNSFSWVGAVAKPELTALWEATQETIAVHVRWGGERVCVEELPSPHPIRYSSTVGSKAPLATGSAGKAMLAAMPVEEFESLLQGLELQPLTDRTIVDIGVLRKEVATVRQQGYALSEGERIEGASAVSKVIHGPQGLVGSVSILGPRERLTMARRKEYLPLLTEKARIIEDHLNRTGFSA